MVRPRASEAGKRRLMISEEAFKILQEISAIAGLASPSAASETIIKRYGAKMKADYLALVTAK